MEYVKKNFWNLKRGQAGNVGKHFNVKQNKLLGGEGIKIKTEWYRFKSFANHKIITTIVIATIGFILLDASLLMCFVDVLAKI